MSKVKKRDPRAFASQEKDCTHNNSGGERRGVDRPKGPMSMLEYKIFVRQFACEAIEVLVRIMRNDKLPARLRMKAASSILDRAYGKPAEATNTTGETASETSEPVKFETFEEVRQELLERGLDIRAAPLELIDLRNEDE